MKIKVNKEIYLRTPKISDAKDIFAFASDDEHTKFLTYNTHKHIDETKNLLTNIWKKGSRYHPFVIVYQKQVVGTCDIQMINYRYEIGYQLHKDFRRRGILTQSLKALLQIFFNENPNEKVYIWAEKDNVPSWAIIYKLGFKKTEILYDKKKDDKRPLDVNDDMSYYYALSKDTYSVA